MSRLNPTIRVDVDRSPASAHRAGRALDRCEGAAGTRRARVKTARQSRRSQSVRRVPVLGPDEMRRSAARGFIMTGKHRLGCFGARDQGRCDNHLTIRRDEVEARVLTALQDKLLRQDLFEEFCRRVHARDEPACGWNTAPACRHGRSARSSDRARDPETRASPSWTASRPVRVKDELKALDARRKELQAQLDTADAPPPLLHPEMAELYRAEGHDAGSGPGARRNAHRSDGGASRAHRRHRH